MSRISGTRDRYHSLDYSLFYSYPGKERRVPSDVNFELVSVVKARKLNSDLYVVFIIDGEKTHFSSSRAAILKPIPGRGLVNEWSSEFRTRVSRNSLRPNIWPSKWGPSRSI